MRSKERLRRAEAAIARVEAMALEAGLQIEREVDNLATIFWAEIMAGALVTAAVPVSAKSPQEVAASALQTLANLQEASRETGPAWLARVDQMFADVRDRATRTGKPEVEAFIEEVLGIVSAKVR